MCLLVAERACEAREELDEADDTCAGSAMPSRATQVEVRRAGEALVRSIGEACDAGVEESVLDLANLVV